MKKFVLALATGALALAGAVAVPTVARAASVCNANGSCVTEVQFSASAVDATKVAPAPVTVRVHLVSPVGMSTDQFALSFLRDSNGESSSNPYLKLTTGTAKDGWWQTTVSLPGGIGDTWRLNFRTRDTTSTDLDVTSAELIAAGLTNAITTKVTAAPAVPTGVTFTTAPSCLILPVRCSVVATLRWSKQATGAVAAGWWEFQPAGACAAAPSTLPVTSVNANTFTRTVSGPVLCTVKLRAVNSFGASPWSGSFSAVLP